MIQIRTCMVENWVEKNKRACTFIRQLRVTFFHLIAIYQFYDISIYMTNEAYIPNFINFGRSAPK